MKVVFRPAADAVFLSGVMFAEAIHAKRRIDGAATRKGLCPERMARLAVRRDGEITPTFDQCRIGGCASATDDRWIVRRELKDEAQRHVASGCQRAGILQIRVHNRVRRQ